MNTRPSTAEPILEGEFALTPPPIPSADPATGQLVWIAAVAGALVLLLGGGFLALGAISASGGAATPEEAVDQLIAAVNNEDFLTVAQLLEPGERRTIAEPLISDVMPELTRIGVFSDDLNPADVEGFDIELTDVTYRIDPLVEHPDLVHVFFTGGQSSVELDVDSFPFGDRFRDEVGHEFATDGVESDEITDSTESTPMVLVQREGRWYVSGLFSVAEAARADSGQDLPFADQAPPALGSNSPDAAVESMIAEMVELDLAGMIGRTDPEEMAALYRYSPIFLSEAQEELDEVKSEARQLNASWGVTELDLEVDENGDDADVVIRGFTATFRSDEFNGTMSYGRDRITAAGSIPGENARGSFDATPRRVVIEASAEGESVYIDASIDPDNRSLYISGTVSDESFAVEVNFDETGECSNFSVTVDGEVEEAGCLEDDGYGGAMMWGLSSYVDYFFDLDDEFSGMTIATHRTDGQWYVSPIGTGMSYYVGVLERMDEGSFAGSRGSALVSPFFPLYGPLFYGFYGYGYGGLFAEDYTYTEVDRLEDLDEAQQALQAAEDARAEAELAAAIAEFEDEPREVRAEPSSNFATIYEVESGGFVSTVDQLDSGTYDRFLVVLESGDAITLSVRATPGTDLDTTVELFDADGRSVGYNDDAPATAGLGLFDSRLVTKVSESGTYSIEVHSFGDAGSGEYSLTIERN